MDNKIGRFWDENWDILVIRVNLGQWYVTEGDMKGQYRV